ncbi:VanZ family protein [Thalassotalea mangrovi]|uniref:VanZ family protein n=1 Tax=Thalassotalea mangrovi TaxID=2572245 RepID=A0A4U1B1P7_9GAMM|nr:VanZ family protein [Thalassotalea mangrovi]TKB43095.1 VanZ family protein [Thalassotalea mangrovi]
MSLLLALTRRYWILLTMLMMSIICVLSLYPLQALPVVPGTDKTHHFLAYFALVMPMALKKPNYWPVLVLSFIGISGAIELIQPFVNRYGEWLDLTANISGVIAGFMVAQIINRIFPEKKLTVRECNEQQAFERE